MEGEDGRQEEADDDDSGVNGRLAILVIICLPTDYGFLPTYLTCIRRSTHSFYITHSFFSESLIASLIETRLFEGLPTNFAVRYGLVCGNA